MSDIIREALFALADRIEEANGKPISVDTAAAYALRAALAAPVAQEPARELIGYACDKRGALMPDRCGECLCWPAYQDAIAPAADQPHTVAVPRELLETLLEEQISALGYTNTTARKTQFLLGKEDEA